MSEPDQHEQAAPISDERDATGIVAHALSAAQLPPAIDAGGTAIVSETLPLPEQAASPAADTERAGERSSDARGVASLQGSRAWRRLVLLMGGIGGALLLVLSAVNHAVPMAAHSSGGEPHWIDCPDKIALNTAIVLDVSGVAGEAAKDALLARIKAQINVEASGVHRISVFTTSARSTDWATPVVSRCKPPGKALTLTSAPVADQGTSATLIDIVQKTLNAAGKSAPAAKAAPITQIVADVSLSQYLRAPANTLLVFSDMIEDTNEFSILACRDPRELVDAFRNARRGGVERPAFGNTRIMVNLIPHVGLSKEVVRCRQFFWNWFFGDVDGPQAKLEFDYLPGGNDVALLRKGNAK